MNSYIYKQAITKEKNMAATSVTGKGLGHAVSVKGSEHQSLGAEKLVGPRVVVCDTVTLTGTSATVILPLLSGVVGDYIVLATDADSTAAAAVAAQIALDSVNERTIVSLTGPSSGVVAYSIVKKGIAL
jgi:hypothetical protein